MHLLIMKKQRFGLMSFSKVMTLPGAVEGHFSNSMWAWVINPLTSGLGYRARRNPEPQSVWFCLVLAPVFSLVSATGLISEVPNPNI
jgi:hypothetical protein